MIPPPLLECPAINQPSGEYLRSVGTVFAEFGQQTQDSGNVSYGVQVGDARFFVKTAGRPDDPLPFLDHPARVALLGNAARLSAAVSHPILPRLLGVVESPDGPLLVYPWLDGELLGVSREQRNDPRSAFQRFRHLPPPTICSCLDAVFDLHDTLARAGWIAVDFYDGSLLYDFAAGRLWAVDLDMCRHGPFHNERGRMFGSTRFMAPEEFERGALIDEQTTVFVLGRTALVFLSDGTLAPQEFRGPRPLFDVVAQACTPDRSRRFASVRDFHHTWRKARAFDFSPCGPV